MNNSRFKYAELQHLSGYSRKWYLTLDIKAFALDKTHVVRVFPEA